MSKKVKIVVPREEYYYYIREDEDRHPRITVCLAVFQDNILCRGVALCSFSEKEINKKIGRTIARNRALKAYAEQHDSCYISRGEARSVIDICGKCSSVVNSLQGLYGSKSRFNINPTVFETKIIGSTIKFHFAASHP